MWKGGSEQQVMTPFPVDPVDPRDPVDPQDPVESSETPIFDNPSVDFEIKLGNDFSKAVPNLKQSLPVYAKRYVAKT
mgnify:CR=1 FL=1